MSNNLNDEWENFINNYDANCETEFAFPAKFVANDKIDGETSNIEPMCDELYISTKTMLLYLDKSNIDVSKIFWKLPIVEYWKPVEGIIKKQMKVASHSKEECAENMRKLAETYYYTERIIKQIDNPVAKKTSSKTNAK